MKLKFHWTVKLTFVSQEKVGSPPSRLQQLCSENSRREDCRKSMAKTQSCQVIKTKRIDQAIRLRDAKREEDKRRKVNFKFKNFEICS
jgi:hypothetical protein